MSKERNSWNAYWREYYHKNRDKLLEYRKEYYKRTKESKAAIRKAQHVRFRINKAKRNRQYIVYICAPYAGDVNLNTARALMLARKAYDEHFTVITPHVMFPYLDDSTDREEVIKMCKRLVLHSDEIWVLGDDISEGMAEELEVAAVHNKNVKFFTQDFEECVLPPVIPLEMAQKISDAVSKARR